MFRLLPVLLLPTLAFAQATATTPLVIQVSGVADVTLYPETCTQTLSGKWFSVVTAPACDPLKLWATSGDCADAPASGDVRFDDVPVSALAAGSGPFNVKVSTLPSFKVAATPCGGGPYEVVHKICGALSTSTGFDCTFTTTRSVVRATPATLTYDTAPPSAPTLDAVNEVDSALQVYFTAFDDAVAVEVWLRAPGETDFTYYSDFSASAGNARVDGLTNGVAYEVVLYAIDTSGNPSDPSNVLSGTPRQTNGFWAAYQGAGGGEKGCGSSATGFAGPLAWLALLAVSTRRKR